MKIIFQDITKIRSGIIAHQVNTKRIMGAGLALKLKRQYPLMFQEYQKAIPSLGKMLVTKVTNELYIACLYGQQTLFEKQNTDYDSLRKAMIALQEFADGIGKQVYLPYRIGCGLAGGEWAIVCDIIQEYIPEAIVCKL